MAKLVEPRYSPSALASYLACPHLTTLELAVARGEIDKPYRHNPHADLIRLNGDECAARYGGTQLSRA